MLCDSIIHCKLSRIPCRCGEPLSAGIILCMRPANERWRCNATSSLIGWAHWQNDLCVCTWTSQSHNWQHQPLHDRLCNSLNPLLLSHPGLGWLYVFSSFLPRPQRPPHRRPPPQQLLALTTKLFELNFTYLVQRIYGSGEMYWMTFPWPWPKVTAVTSIS